MSEEQKKLIDETVENLKHLNKESLLIVKGGTEMLKARDAMSAEQEQKNGTGGGLNELPKRHYDS